MKEREERITTYVPSRRYDTQTAASLPHEPTGNFDPLRTDITPTHITAKARRCVVSWISSSVVLVAGPSLQPRAHSPAFKLHESRDCDAESYMG